MNELEAREKLVEVLKIRYKNDLDVSDWNWIPPEDVLDYVFQKRSVENVVRDRLAMSDDLRDIYGLFYPPLVNLGHSVKMLVAKKLLSRIKEEFDKAKNIQEYSLLIRFCGCGPEFESMRVLIEAKIKSLSMDILGRAKTLSEFMDAYEHLKYSEQEEEMILEKVSQMTFTFAEAAQAIERIYTHPDNLECLLFDRMIDLATSVEECELVFEKSYCYMMDDTQLRCIRKLAMLLSK